ncbi:hypothetical protein HOI18_00415 [Candidatus Uhrbacteria bacterium]|jgi:hypothetical protein|nr:hypothetical protein [Candidatus Uhrbacteria bacterium]
MARRNHVRRTARKSYHSRSYKNPFFQKKTTIPWKGILVAVICTSTIVFGVVTLLSNSRFKINNVDIGGLEHISRPELESVISTYLDKPASIFFKRSNAFLFDREQLVSAISDRFTFADVEVSTSGDTLFLTITERTSNLIWQTGDRGYIIDLEGIVVREFFVSELSEVGFNSALNDLPVFSDINNLEVEIGGTVLTANEITGAFTFHDHLKQQGIDFTRTDIDRLAGKWVSVETVDGYSILFDPTADVDEQASRLKTLLETEVGEGDDLQYIDLRFGDHIYFR